MLIVVQSGLITNYNIAAVDCTRMGCAQGINRCSKETKTSKDTKTLTHIVKCFNSEGKF